MLLVFALRLISADPLEPVDQDPDAVRREACEVVSRDDSICSPPEPRPPSTSSGPGLDWLGYLLWLVLIGLVLFAVVALVRHFIARGGGRKKKNASNGDDENLDEIEIGAVAVDRSREPTNWREEAEQHRRAGRYREALRCRYRALVGDLARRGLIDEIPGRTTGEERTQLRHVQPVADMPFTSAADLFDNAWYGHLAVDADDDDAFQALERDVLTRTGTSATKASR